ncbi:proteasome activator complex subunit 1 [Latimeria chalumnae]|uniref:Proteasome activator complex subunit 1 n=1 Tax=Latimeria chalumnae TaxID=7897 RepID=M3XHW5_LATCH|nr:PREDICTED: proteasome activator complex subunit 1 [Latimeria chalumnae]|eukprot:XP_014353054.1 PREDICTED: proteasome activator complex subunit 1 [Latimeria chalumnae]
METLEVTPEVKQKVDTFRKELCNQAEELIANYFPKKTSELDRFLKDGDLNISDLSTIKAELDIPIPDPTKEEKKEKKEDKDDKKSDDEDKDKGPPCGPVSSNEKIVALLNRVKPEIQEVKEKLNMVSIWLQLQIPKVEDGNNFGVAVQEKVFELMTNTRTKIEGFQTQISKYFSERGDAVAKAAKQPHVGDYRQLVHELDEAEYAEIRVMVMEIRNTYAILHDIVFKNYEKIKKPKGESRAPIY